MRSFAVVCCMLESCLYVLSMCTNMFVLPVYLHARGINFQFWRKRRALLLIIIVILQPLCVFYLLPVRDTFDYQLPSFILPANILINSQRARARARAFRNGACICKN